jgi:hypothetical protein
MKHKDSVMTTAVASKMPLTERINFRMLAVVAVVLGLVGYPVYTFVQASLNGGVQKVGDLNVVDLKALGNFPFNEDTSTINDVPAKWRELNGKRVALEGFMVPANSAGEDVSQFQFVYNVTKCCFNGPPRVQERVFARVPNGTVPYYGVEVRCVGTLHVAVTKNDAGKTNTVYVMDVDKVDQL